MVHFRLLFCLITYLLFQSNAECSDEFKIAAFNVQVFGQTKLSKQHVVDVLIDVIQRYDIILIQEIRDSQQTAITTLLEKVNSHGPHEYKLSISERLGKSSSKEQYAFLFRNTSNIRLKAVHQFVDNLNVFERPPYSVLFQTDDTVVDAFALMAIHTKPDNAVNETNRLYEAHADLARHWGTDNIIILGDLNADCSYITRSEMESLRLRTDRRFRWFIDDHIDSTISNSDCAYDRFIMSGQELIDSVVNDSAQVFRFDVKYGLNQSFAQEVSDHYPIELQLVTLSAISAAAPATSAPWATPLLTTLLLALVPLGVVFLVRAKLLSQI